MTSEKKDLIVDSYLKWRISDFSRYYLATGGGDVSQAEVLLKRKFSDRLRSEIGRTDVKDIVTDSRGKLMSDVRDALNTGTVGDGEEVATTEADDAIASAAARVERNHRQTAAGEPEQHGGAGHRSDRRAYQADQPAGGSVRRYLSAYARRA